MIELYHAGLTTCSKKVRLCLREKNLSYVSRFVDLTKFEQHRPEYLALNPNGQVPTLVHDGVVVIESTVINEYLDDAFPDVPLRPSSAGERAHMRVWAKLSDEAMAASLIFALASQTGFGDAVRKLGVAEPEGKLEQFPEPERRNAIRKAVSGNGYNESELEEARGRAGFIVERAEQALAHGPYLAAASYSLADINMIPYIDRFKHRILQGRITARSHPRLSEWYERVMSRPAVQESFAASVETSAAA